MRTRSRIPFSHSPTQVAARNLNRTLVFSPSQILVAACNLSLTPAVACSLNPSRTLVAAYSLNRNHSRIPVVVAVGPSFCSSHPARIVVGSRKLSV